MVRRILRRLMRGRRETSPRRRAPRVVGGEHLEDRQLLAADLIVSEFMARNSGGLRDAGGDSPDWVEIHNPTAQPVAMQGWSLTDDPAVLDKWSFPDIVIEPGAYRVVFASGKEIAQPSLSLTRDWHGVVDDTFRVDLPDGTYTVQTTMGDIDRVRDRMAVYLQGRLVDTVNAFVGEYVVNTYTADVTPETGGQLAIRIQDLGGDTGRAVINALVIERVDGDDVFRFDFGVSDSPVEPGYIRVDESHVYAVENGFGWLPGEVFNARDRGPGGGELHAGFALNGDGEFLALVAPDQTIVSDFGGGDAPFPVQHPNASFGWVGLGNEVDPPIPGYFPTPTPGEANSDDDAMVGPLVLDVTHNPGELADDEDLVITARVDQLNAPVDTVRLVYRVMFRNDNVVDMNDDGIGADVTAGDGIYSAAIPHRKSTVGEMVRWYVQALDADGHGALAPFSGLPADGQPFGFGQDFEEGAAQGFDPRAGTWEVTGGRYRVTPDADNDTVSLINAVDQLPESIQISVVAATPEETPHKNNAAIIFDYKGPEDFKFASVHVTQQALRIGARDASGWDTIAQRTLPDLTAGDEVLISIEIVGTLVSARVGDLATIVNFRNDPLNDGQLALGTKGGETFFDELAVSSLQDSPEDRPVYYGSIVADTAIQSNLPVLHWFVENPQRARSELGAGTSLYYDGTFYDNIHVDSHGQSTRGFPKPSYDFDFNSGMRFQFSDEFAPISDFNLLTNWADKTKIRNTLAYESYADADHPGHLAFPVRVEQNGEFYGVYDWVDEGGEEYLERNGLDPRGAMYKVNNSLTSVTSDVEKRTRRHEDRSDLQELVDYGDSALPFTIEQRNTWFFDNLDIASWVNFLAAFIPNGNIDCCHKNYYVYRDSEGTRQWHIFPWDVDLSFGHNWNSSEGYFDDDLIWSTGLFIGNNAVTSKLFGIPEFREMYLRRVRTLLDDLLQPPGTPQEDLKFEARIDELIAQIGDDGALNQAKWGFPVMFAPRTPAEASDDLDSQYFPNRRAFLYNLADLPPAPLENPQINFGVVDSNPTSTMQSEEFIELVNPHDEAVDISGWRLSGAGVQMTFRGGTVLPSGGSLYATPDVRAFLNRQSGPQGGQRLLVQGNYQGRLTNSGGSLELRDDSGRLVAATVFEGQASPYQQHLRLTELNFNPYSALTQFGDANVDNDQFEFVELLNTGTDPLMLEGVAFTDGIDFTFGDTTLAGGERILVVGDQTAFESRYGPEHAIAGEFDSGRLNNGGETVRLEDPNGNVVLEFTYRDDNSWPRRADGIGSSLEVIDFEGAYGEPSNWRNSTEFGGSPGTGGSGPVVDIVINEVLARPTPGQPDAIELHNVTGAAVDAAHWYLSDDADDLFAYHLPSPSVIEASEYVVVESTEFGFGLDGTFGDQLWLLAADGATGRPTRFADDVRFDGSETGTTLGRWPDGQAAAPLLPMASPTLGSVNAGPAATDVLLSEVHYDPGDGQEDLEFVELANVSETSIDLEGWRLSQAVDWEFPAGATLESGKTIVLVGFDPADGTLADRFRTHFGAGLTVPLMGPYAGDLSDSGEALALMRPLVPGGGSGGFVVADFVAFEDQSPWPVEASGGGRSLHRSAPATFGNAPENWLARVPSPGDFVRAGDVDGNGLLEQADQEAFALGLKRPFEYQDTYGFAPVWRADMNADGRLDFDDIAGFVDIVGLGTPSVEDVEQSGAPIENYRVIQRFVGFLRSPLPPSLDPSLLAQSDTDGDGDIDFDDISGIIR